MSIKTERILVRFLKGFIAVEVPIIIAAITNVGDVTDIGQLKAFAIALILPSATGLLLALEKWAKWDNQPT